MHKRTLTYVSTFVVLTSLSTIACDSATDTTTTASITGPSFVATGRYAPALSADPAVVAAQYQPNTSCRTHTPFGADVTVVIRPGHSLYLHRFAFEYLDPSGRTVVPSVFPGTTDTTNGLVLPIPFPTTYPIPFPGLVPMSGVRVEAGVVARVPFRVQFDCGVPVRGTLAVSLETADATGATTVSRLRAEIQ